MNKDIFMSINIANKNSELMDMYFTLNKKLDNLMDYLDIVLVMPNFSKEIHRIAHISPLDADRFRDYNALYSYRTVYSTIQGQYKDFENILEGFVDVIDYIVDIDNNLNSAKELAMNENNDDYKKFISEEVKELRKYKKQFILFNDIIEKYLIEGNSLRDLDSRIEDYFIGM